MSLPDVPNGRDITKYSYHQLQIFMESPPDVSPKVEKDIRIDIGLGGFHFVKRDLLTGNPHDKDHYRVTNTQNLKTIIYEAMNEVYADLSRSYDMSEANTMSFMMMRSRPAYMLSVGLVVPKVAMVLDRKLPVDTSLTPSLTPAIKSLVDDVIIPLCASTDE